MAKVSPEVHAQAANAEREIAGLERFLDQSSRRISSLFNRGMSRQAVTGTTKDLQSLTRAADEARRKVENLEQALPKVRTDKEQFATSVPLSQKQRHLNLEAQERRLERLHWNAVGCLSDLDLRRSALPSLPVGGGGGFQIGRMGNITQFIGGIAKQFLGPLALIGTATGASAVCGGLMSSK